MRACSCKSHGVERATHVAHEIPAAAPVDSAPAGARAHGTTAIPGRTRLSRANGELPAAAAGQKEANEEVVLRVRVHDVNCEHGHLASKGGPQASRGNVIHHPAGRQRKSPADLANSRNRRRGGARGRARAGADQSSNSRVTTYVSILICADDLAPRLRYERGDQLHRRDVL